MRIVLFALPFIIAPNSLWAVSYYGRASIGGFTSKETFSEANSGSNANDFQTASGRFYLRVADITKNDWDFVMDARDKYDQFDKLNTTAFQLEPKNSFHFRQLYTSNLQSDSNFLTAVGRFPLFDTGGSYLDGVQFQYKWGRWRGGAYGGLDPFNPETEQFDNVSKYKAYGIFSHWEPLNQSWSKNFFMTHSYVTRLYQSETDRRYFYQNIFYKWGPNSRLFSTTYLDFVPRTYAQLFTFRYDQDLWKNAVSHIDFIGVDAIQYRRNQGVRETLAPSQYQQGQVQLDIPIAGSDSKNTVSPSYLYGKRQLDQLIKQETKLKFNFVELGSNFWDLRVSLGTRKNFVSNDQFSGLELGYYRARYEVTTEANYAIEKYETKTLHPLTLLLSTTWIPSRDLFFSISGEYAKDEEVLITSAYFKLTYRFGSKESPPLRDGAPPRGTL